MTFEAFVIPSQDVLGELAGRIERAYRRKHPEWSPIGVMPGAWAAAASRLCQVRGVDGDLPIDPEMFVAVQPEGRPRLDPWLQLTQPAALKRYLRSIRRVVAGLHRELRSEVRLGELLAIRGESLEQIVTRTGARISPLSQYIIAHRAGRLDLAMLMRPAARNQDRSCPLYRLAARPFLPTHLYPSGVEPRRGDVGLDQDIVFSLN